MSGPETTTDSALRERFRELRDELAQEDKQVLEALDALDGEADTTDMVDELDELDSDQLRYRRKKLVGRNLISTRAADGGSYAGAPPTVFEFTDRGRDFMRAGLYERTDPGQILDTDGQVLDDDAEPKEIARAFRALHGRYEEHVADAGERIEAVETAIENIQGRVVELENDSGGLLSR